MNEYKELIEMLRHQVINDDDAKEIADAIEQLVIERDAAVADLKSVLKKRIITMDGSCDICVGTHDMCDTCFLGNKWEWRGVKEDNT